MTETKPIDPYMALALQTVMVGARSRDDFQQNIDHIIELAFAAKNVTEIELPVKLYALPEASIQGFTDEIFDMDHEDYVEQLAIDVPGKETDQFSNLARALNAFIVMQAKVTHPEFPKRFFNSAFVIDPNGEIIHKYYKLQVFAREHTTLPHDVWDKWVELYGENLDAFYPVVDTEIGRIGTHICMEGSFPEITRGLAMNGAEITYRPSYPEPYVSNGMWEVQNRARALDNTMYMICPNTAAYAPTSDSKFPLDMFGGHSMIVDYHGQLIADAKSAGTASYAGAVIDIEGLRKFRQNSLFGNFMKDLRTEQYRLIYDQPMVEKNRCLHDTPLKHAESDARIRGEIEGMIERGIWKRPAR